MYESQMLVNGVVGGARQGVYHIVHTKHTPCPPLDLLAGGHLF